MIYDNINFLECEFESAEHLYANTTYNHYINSNDPCERSTDSTSIEVPIRRGIPLKD